MEAGDDAIYSMAKLSGRAAAAIVAQRAEEAEQGIPPHWNLYVTVEDVDAPAARSPRPAARCSPSPST